MNFPRVTAVLFLLLLLGSLSLVCIGTMNLIASTYVSGSSVEHVEGEIVQMRMSKSGMDFVLETANRQLIHFQCASLCHASPSHIERHLREHAETDVYYMEQPGNRLLAVDVD